MSALTHDRSLIQDSFRLFRRHPQVLAPLLAAWLVYAPAVLYLKFGIAWDALSQRDGMLIVFGAIFLFATILTVSCSLLLELLQDLESGKEPSLGRAIRSTLHLNLIQMIPIIIVWTVIWFVLVVIQTMLSRKKKRGNRDRSFSAENVARSLAGDGKAFSFSAAFFRVLQKLVRMIVFLILPAIAWQNLSFHKAIRRGIAIFRTHPKQFVAAFGMTELVTLLLFLPAGVLLYASKKFDFPLPDPVWAGVIVYLGCGWMYSIYLEQMYTAELYLWHMKWERAAALRQAAGKATPALGEVPRPSLLDRVYELAQEEAKERESRLPVEA